MTATVGVDLTCPYCGMTADARRVKVVQVAASPAARYAHEKCWLRRFDEARKGER